jgi:hypothetical protein
MLAEIWFGNSLERLGGGYELVREQYEQELAAERACATKLGYVEFEPRPPLERPLLESAKICFDYLHTTAHSR